MKTKSEFSRHVITLMTGTTIAQAIPIAISPILTRLYSPEQFGIFALYMSLVTIISVIATARYELAILLPKEKNDAINIVALSITLSFFISSLLLVIVYLYNLEITSILGTPSISNWLYFIPLSVFLLSIFNNLNYWNNREKEYGQLSKSRILQSGITASSNLAFGITNFTGTGLIVSSILGQFFTSLMLGLKFLPHGNQIYFKQMSKVSKRYIYFPKFSMPAGIINISAKEVPKIIIANIFEVSILGFLTLGQRIILVPVALFSSSIQQVFFQQASEIHKKKGSLSTIYNKTLKKLFFIAIIPFLLLFILAPSLFSFMFGEEWEIAGKIVRILIPFYFIYFIASPFNIIFTIVEAQKLELHWQIVFLSLSVGSLILGSILTNNMYYILGLFSFANTIAFLYGLSLTRKLAND